MDRQICYERTIAIPRRLNFDTDDDDRAVTPPPTMAEELHLYNAFSGNCYEMC